MEYDWCEPDSTVHIEEVETSTPTPLEKAQSRLHMFEEMAEHMLVSATEERDRLIQEIIIKKTHSSAMEAQLRILKERHLEALRHKQTVQTALNNNIATYINIIKQYNSEITWQQPSIAFAPEEVDALQARVQKLRDLVALRLSQLEERPS